MDTMFIDKDIPYSFIIAYILPVFHWDDVDHDEEQQVGDDLFGKCLRQINFKFLNAASIEKHLEMPCSNLLCLQRICLFVYVCSVTKNKITKPYARNFDGKWW